MEFLLNQDAISTALFDPAARHTMEWKLHWLFRFALCCEFVGHGAFGVLTKAAWVHYFVLFGFSEARAYGAWWEVLERGSSYAAPLLWIGFQQCAHRTRGYTFSGHRSL
jgi:hypothetical protein